MRSSTLPTSSTRRITLSPDHPSRSATAKAKGAKRRHDETPTSSSSEERDAKRLRILAGPKQTQVNVPRLLQRIRFAEDATAALVELADILQEETSDDGTTLALFYCGGHLDVVRSVQTALIVVGTTTYTSATTITTLQQQQQQQLLQAGIRVLYLLCCRPGYYKVPEVLGVSCLNTSLVYAGAIHIVFEALTQSSNPSTKRSTEDTNNETMTQRAFAIVDAVMMGYTFAKIVQLGVPRRTCDLLQMFPNNPRIVVRASELLLTLTLECQNASRKASWAVDEDDNNPRNDSNLLRDAYELLLAASERFRYDNDDSTNRGVREMSTKAMQSIRDIYRGDNDSGEEDNDENNYEGKEN